ncbi:hypothetical protein RJ639_027826 [Escallonia herrerae]|uniref:Uncharacterized protein n=1 Tax=Escallonia herrerae TaxID=1293975 RepID=A0AA88XJK2_9ASTE|nr:hypothetical protein RJ639_027826 [Escallonia herrerae]
MTTTTPSRPEDSITAASPLFGDGGGIATKDIHIDPLTSLSIHIFLPNTYLGFDLGSKAARVRAGTKGSNPDFGSVPYSSGSIIIDNQCFLVVL